MSNAIRGLQPEAVWRHFAAISAIPRCSKKEGAVRDYVKGEAERLGLTHRTDGVGNIVVVRPGAPGRGDTPVVIQGHLDMVCEKNMGVTHDFDCDPITLVRDGEWMKADNTTLGADNGIAVAMMLALLETEGLEIGPVECLFTVDEETGLTGALHMDPTLITGRTLINLDSEEEGFFCIGCAGGRNTYGRFEMVWQDLSSRDDLEAWEVKILGLQGGHSGADIHLGRGNSLRLAGRLLGALRNEDDSLRIADIRGGDKHNAIPREFSAVVLARPERSRRFTEIGIEMDKIFRDELGGVDDAVRVEISGASTPERALTATESGRIIDLMAAMPHGVLGMSKEVPGLVETSTNFAAIHVEGSAVSVLTSQRSSRGSLIAAAAESVAATMHLAGGDVRYGEAYPAWPPRPESPIVDTAVETYRRVFHDEPTVGAFHAGLECGVIGDKVGNMDMISFGPEMSGVHTPEERVSIPSTERTWHLLLEILAAI